MCGAVEELGGRRGLRLRWRHAVGGQHALLGGELRRGALGACEGMHKVVLACDESRTHSAVGTQGASPDLPEQLREKEASW